MAIPSVAKLASMALLNPGQVEMLSRENRALSGALGGRGASMPYDGIDGARADLQEMDLFARGERENPAVPVPDPNALRDMLARNKETMDLGTAPEYSLQQKNQLWQMAKQLRDEIRVGMPSYDQLERATQENCDVFRIHQERTMHKQLALRNIIRILDPRDETVILETLRPTTPSHVDWESYYGNFDQLYFSDEAELAREINALDDETYAKFMQLRLRGVDTPRLIQRTLGISLGVYEACKQRLERDLAALEVDDADEGDDPPVTEVSPGETSTKETTQARSDRRQSKGSAQADDMTAFAAAH